MFAGSASCSSHALPLWNVQVDRNGGYAQAPLPSEPTRAAQEGLQDGGRSFPFPDQAVGVREGAEGARVHEREPALGDGVRSLLPASRLRIEQVALQSVEGPSTRVGERGTRPEPHVGLL